MVMKDTINTDKYLYVKKLLCMLALSRLQKCIKVDDKEYDEDSLKTELLDELKSLHSNITMPSYSIRTNTSFINFEDVFNATIEIIESPDNPTKNSTLWVYQKKVEHVTSHDIYELPNKQMAFAELVKDYQNRKQPYDNVRQYLVKIINGIDYLLSIITSYVANPKTTVGLPLVIFYMNTIEFIDWTFSLSEFGETIFSEQKDDEQYG